MSVCPHCRVFSGSPTCAICKTYFRVGSLLQSGRLSPYQETPALGALRNCAGALADLVEIGTAGPFGPRSTAEAEGGPLELGREPLSKEPDTSGKEKEAEEEKPATEVKAAKPAKKEKTKGKRKDKSKKPKSRSRSKEKRKDPAIGEKAARREGEALRSTGSRREHSEDERDRSRERPRREGREEDRRRVEKRRSEEEREPSARDVEREPARYGLEHIPIRGSAGRHRNEERIPAGSRRPAEPIGAPPQRRGSRGDDEEWRDSSGYRHPGHTPKKWKGLSHYYRGVDFWKRRKSGR
eukprot:s627_g12.t1